LPYALYIIALGDENEVPVMDSFCPSTDIHNSTGVDGKPVYYVRNITCNIISY